MGWNTAGVATVLEREMYTEAEAGRLLGVHQSTLHYWLEGAERPDKTYPPVIREAPRGGRSVTWGEFVEAGLLREYRRTHRVRMPELRRFVDFLRQSFGVPYPLADRRPYVSGRQLVFDAQTAAELGVDYWLVAVANDQLLLTGPSEIFFKHVVWDGDVAAAWRPDPSRPRSLVRIDPNIRFGRPSIKGISTRAIWEQVESGEDVAAVADIYGLTLRDVRAALAYQNAEQVA
jgi:uncharacterized protein (DUF433 family)